MLACQVAAAEQGESLWEAVSSAARSPLAYQRREPEKTLLHAAVRERLETFLDAVRERSSTGRGLPAFVEQNSCTA